MTHPNNKSRSKCQTFQLIAVIASCGASFEVDVNPTITGIELKQKIAEDTSISMDDQVLFTQNGIKLKKINLELRNSRYNHDIFIFTNNRYTISMAPHIYIFDKNHSQHPSISSEYVLNATDYEIKEEKMNASQLHLTSSQTKKLENHPLFNNESLLFQTLPKYEIEFESHYNLSLFVKNECLKKMNAAKKYVKQIQFQYKSLKVLLKHFHYLLHEKLNKQENKFIQKCDQQISQHQEYLNDFETDLTNLQCVELHSSLQTKSRKTMLDVVDEGSFRDWYKKAYTAQEKQKNIKMDRQKNIETIEKKLCNIKQSIEDIKRKKINFITIKKKLQKNETFYGELEDIIHRFHQNLKKVENTINIIMDADGNEELIKFGPTEMEKCKKKQINIDLIKIKEINDSFYGMLQHIAAVQEAMVNEFTLNVSDITSLNGLISSESKTMDAYTNALVRKDELFFEFVKLKALPSAYKHCLIEIIRRRAFGILINNEINNHIYNIFNSFRNKEIAKRKAFINEYGMLPVDLVNGLTKMPGNIKINYDKKNEDCLPIIDRNIDKIHYELCKEFETSINEYGSENNNCKWKWSQTQLKSISNGYGNNEEKKQINNIHLFKEQNKWKREKLRLTSSYEDKISTLQNEIKELESHNQNIEIELDQIKRIQFPSPPDMDAQDSIGFDGMSSEYIASQLSTILGASISNVNPSKLEQSMLFLSRIKSQNNNNEANDNLIATNQVLQNDLDKLKSEIISKDNTIKKLNIENDKLKKQNNEFIIKLDKLKESSIDLRNEIESMLLKHKQELEEIDSVHKHELVAQQENDTQEIVKLEQDIITYKNDIDKLGEGRTDLLKQIKMLSDVNEEWEEKFNKLRKKFVVYKSEKEQKDSDDWMTMSYLTNENDQRKQAILTIKSNSIWLNGSDEYIKSESIAGNKLLFIRDKTMNAYRAVLDYDAKSNIPIILDEEMIKNNLKKLKYPTLLTAEVIYIIQQIWPQNIGQLKKGDPILIATAGCLKPVNFTFS